MISIAKQNGYAGTAFPSYDAPFNLVLGIWGIPLYFIQRSLDVDFRVSFWATAYGKSLFLLALGASLVLIYKICIEFGINKQRSSLCSFLFLTSALTTTCIGVIGQSDIVSIVFILLGFLNYVRHKNGWFFFWFIVAYPFKQYALFVFIPLLLLRDKNIVRVLVKTATMVVVTWLSNAPVRNDSDILAYKEWFSSAMLAKLLENRLPLLYEGAPVLVVLLCIVI